MAYLEDPRVFVHRIDARDYIIEINDDWIAFAFENGAEALIRGGIIGRSLWEFISGMEVRHLYLLLIGKVRENPGVSITIPFRCDSRHLRREMEMEMVADHMGNVEFRNRVIRIEPFRQVHMQEATGEAVGVLTMCSICRRVRSDNNQWQEIEEAVRRYGLSNEDAARRVHYRVCGACYKNLAYKLLRLFPSRRRRRELPPTGR